MHLVRDILMRLPSQLVGVVSYYIHSMRHHAEGSELLLFFFQIQLLDPRSLSTLRIRLISQNMTPRGERYMTLLGLV